MPISLTSTKLPWPVMNDPVAARFPTGGWLVACREGAGVVHDGEFKPLDLPGVVTAAHHDGRRTWVALAELQGATHVAKAIGVFSPDFSLRYPLEVVGPQARPVPWMTVVGEDVLLSSSLAGAPVLKNLPIPGAGGWGVHRLSSAGALVGSVTLVAAQFYDPVRVVRAGDDLFTKQTGQGVIVPLDLSQPKPWRPWNLLASDGVRLGVASGSYDEVREKPISVIEVLQGTPPWTRVELDQAPNTLAVGATFVSWSIAKKLFVRTQDGTVHEPKAGGGVDLQASDGQVLAVVVARTKPPRFHEIAAS